MIAVGDQVIFADLADGKQEPHHGQTGTIRGIGSFYYTLIFPDGQIVWADHDEVTAL